MPGVYDKIARRYDAMHRTWLRHAGGTAQAAFEASVLAHLAPGMAMLDAGCGTGEFARHLTAGLGRKVSLTLFDACAAMLDQASDIDARRRLGCLSDMPFADDSFDLVTAAWSIEASGKPQKALAEMMRVLRPGGILITVFCARQPKVPPLARLLQTTVALRGTGQFLDPDQIARHMENLGASGLTQLRITGPAAVLTCEKPKVEMHDLKLAA